MTTITEGMTPAQFITAMNNNYAAIKYTSTTIDTIDADSDVNVLNGNFTIIKGETYSPPTTDSIVSGIRGSVFASRINNNFSRYSGADMTFTVGGDKNYPTIVTGIARAINGNTLRIDEGTWDEIIDLTAKRLNLVGLGNLETILNHTAAIGNFDETISIGTDSTFNNIVFRKHNDYSATTQIGIINISACNPIFINCKVKCEISDHWLNIMKIENDAKVTFTGSFDCNSDMPAGVDNWSLIEVYDTSTFQFTGSKFKANLKAYGTAYINIDVDHLWTPLGTGLWSFSMNNNSNLDLKINIENHGFTQATDLEFDMWESRFTSLVHLNDTNIFNVTGIVKSICWIDGHHCTVNYTDVTAEWGPCKISAGTGGIQHGISNTNVITIDNCLLVYDAPFHHSIEDYQSCTWLIKNSTIMHMGGSGHYTNGYCQPISIHMGYEGEWGSLTIKDSSIIQYCDTGANGYLQVIGVSVPFDFENVIIETRNSDLVQNHRNFELCKPKGQILTGRLKNVTFINDDPTPNAIAIFDSVEDPVNYDPIDSNDWLCIEGVINQTQQSNISNDMTRYNLLAIQCPN